MLHNASSVVVLCELHPQVNWEVRRAGILTHGPAFIHPKRVRDYPVC